VSVVVVTGLLTVKFFVKINASFTLGLSTEAASQIQVAPGIEAVQKGLYGVATGTAGVPLAIPVVSSHGVPGMPTIESAGLPETRFVVSLTARVHEPPDVAAIATCVIGLTPMNDTAAATTIRLNKPIFRLKSNFRILEFLYYYFF
jgi:hypothetical protein